MSLFDTSDAQATKDAPQEKAPPVMAQIAVDCQKGMACMIGGKVADLPKQLDFGEADKQSGIYSSVFNGGKDGASADAKENAFSGLVGKINETPAGHLASDVSGESRNQQAQLSNQFEHATHLDPQQAAPRLETSHPTTANNTINFASSHESQGLKRSA